MCVTFGPIASSTGLTRSNAASSPPTMTEALPCATVTGLPEIGASSMIEPALANSAATARLASGAIVLMSMIDAALAQAGDDAVLAERHRLAPPRASVTMENTISDVLRDRARRVGPAHAGRDQRRRPSRARGSSRSTVCPASMQPAARSARPWRRGRQNRFSRCVLLLASVILLRRCPRAARGRIANDRSTGSTR